MTTNEDRFISHISKLFNRLCGWHAGAGMMQRVSLKPELKMLQNAIEEAYYINDLYSYRERLITMHTHIEFVLTGDFERAEKVTQEAFGIKW